MMKSRHKKKLAKRKKAFVRQGKRKYPPLSEILHGAFNSVETVHRPNAIERTK